MIPTAWALFRDRKIAGAIADLGKRLRPSWDLLVRTRTPKEDSDRLFEEAVLALWMGPAEFYERARDPDWVRETYRAWRSGA